MAGTTSIEDILSSVVDETAVSALIGSLESKLAAGNTSSTASSLDASPVGSNHVSKAVVASGDVQGNSNANSNSSQQINAVRDGPSAGAAVGAGSTAVVVAAAAPQPVAGSGQATDKLPTTAPRPAEDVQVPGDRKANAVGAAMAEKKDGGNAGSPAVATVVTRVAAAGTPLTGTNSGPGNASISTPTTCVRIITLPTGKSGTVVASSTDSVSIAHNKAAKNAVLPNARTVVKTIAATATQQLQGQSATTVTQTCSALTTVTSSVLSSQSLSTSAGVLSGQQQVIKTQVPAQTGSLKQQQITTAIVASTTLPTTPLHTSASTTQQPQIVLRAAPTLQVPSSAVTVSKPSASSSTVVTLATTTASQVKLSGSGTPGPHSVGIVPQLQQVRLASPQVIAPRTPGGTVQFRLPQGTSLPPGVMLINKDGNIHVVNSSIGPGGQIQHLPGGAVPGTVTYRQVQPGSSVVQRPGTQATSVVQSTIRQNVGQLLNTTNATIGQLKGGAQVVVGGSPVTFLSKSGAPGSPSMTISNQALQTGAAKMVAVSAGGAVSVTMAGAQRAVSATPVAGQPVIISGQPQPIPMSQSAMENVKKCRNFLTTLIKLASNGNQPAETVKNVKELVQNLIDGKTEPEEFTGKLQKELKSSPQPYLIPFLKKSLPLLRQTLQKGGSLQIQGLSAPTVTAAQSLDTSSAATASGIAASQPTLVSTLATGPGGKTTTLNLTAQQLQQLSQQHAAAKSKQNLKMTQLQTFTQKSKAQPVVTTASSKSSSSSSTSSSSHSSSSRSSQSKSHSSKPSSSKSSSSSSSSSKKDKVKDHSSSGFKDDDDINDVTSMAGVNLSEESARILATNADFIGTQLRSIKEEKFLVSGPLQKKVNEICLKHGIQEASPEMMDLVSHAAQERLKGLVEKLGVIAMHRMEVYRTDSRYEVTSDVRAQLKFFEQLDSLERKRRDEQERELLLRAAKSRSKQEDPEQARLKQKAKEMQQMELEQIRQKEANMTALAAIGPRKKRKLDSPTPGSSSGSGSSNVNVSGTPGSPTVRSKIRRIKRVNFRDLIFLMEQEQEMKKSSFFFKMFFK